MVSEPSDTSSVSLNVSERINLSAKKGTKSADSDASEKEDLTGERR